MKRMTAFGMLPALAAALVANNTAIPGMKIIQLDDGTSMSRQLSTQSTQPGPTNFEFYYGQEGGCDAFDAKIVTNVGQDCDNFDGNPPASVYWNNPSNPDDPDNKPYWNLILYFQGDECPVIGHPVQCDTVGAYCVTFEAGRPLSFNVVESTTGIRNCDV